MSIDRPVRASIINTKIILVTVKYSYPNVPRLSTTGSIVEAQCMRNENILGK